MTDRTAKREIATKMFRAYKRAMWKLWAEGESTEAEIEKRFNYKHGWIMVDGENFSHRECFPNTVTYDGH